ncbi:hypothetical protein H8356DRAFT_1431338 [Neocallimastix lanati (nom. inval.)]|nr:hypothetical protein H8356DRAFT_1431338 [Neocallimastix sp. JGI-2020a]
MISTSLMNHPSFIGWKTILLSPNGNSLNFINDLYVFVYNHLSSSDRQLNETTFQSTIPYHISRYSKNTKLKTKSVDVLLMIRHNDNIQEVIIYHPVPTKGGESRLSTSINDESSKGGEGESFSGHHTIKSIDTKIKSFIRSKEEEEKNSIYVILELFRMLENMKAESDKETIEYIEEFFLDITQKLKKKKKIKIHINFLELKYTRNKNIFHKENSINSEFNYNSLENKIEKLSASNSFIKSY